jgi:hypothetical protein
MHFPDSKLPPLAPVTDRTEITPKSPISPTRKVVPGFQDVLDEGGGQFHHPHQADTVAPAVSHEVQPYAGADRRMMCRRIRHVPVLLDTRSGEERRRHEMPDERLPTHMDERA